MKLWILVDHEPVEEPDSLKWAEWYTNKENRILASDKFPDNASLKTVFLGVEMNAKMFESEFCDGTPLGQTFWRYSTWDEAMDFHKNFADLYRKGDIGI